jgi:hypothetical protein
LASAATGIEHASRAESHAEVAVRLAARTTGASESLTARAREFAQLSSQQTESSARAATEFGDILETLRSFDSGGDL